MNNLAERVKLLRDKTGCGMMDCKMALEYAESKQLPDNEDLAIAYLQARGLAVATPKMTFDERVMSFLKAIIREKIRKDDENGF